MRQALYLIADEMRGMASLGKHFAATVYEAERAGRMMELAVQVAALADDAPLEEVRTHFDTEHWLRVSPLIGVEAAVFNERDEILLVQRKDDSGWAMPGGLAEIGLTPAESVLKELWEEAGLRGEVRRLLGIFDGLLWGSRLKVHLLHFIFLVECVNLTTAPGVEMLDARFFAPDALPEAMHPGHELRVPRTIQLWRDGETYFDPASSLSGEMPMYQRPGNP